MARLSGICTVALGWGAIVFGAVAVAIGAHGLFEGVAQWLSS